MYYKSNELTHYGVPGMRWGVKRKGIVATRPKGQQPSWQPKKSDRRKRWEDDNGFNPNRPNGTKPSSHPKVSKGKIAATAILGTLGLTSAAVIGTQAYKLGRSYVNAGKMQKTAELTVAALKRVSDNL